MVTAKVAVLAGVVFIFSPVSAQQNAHPTLAPGAVVPSPTVVPTPNLAPAPTISADYRAVLAAWLESHKHYPAAARQRGEEGRAVLRFRVNRNGRVLDYAVVTSTGYADLDAAVESMMRGATLPPFPSNMTAPEVEVSVTISFGLGSTKPPAAHAPAQPVPGAQPTPLASPAHTTAIAEPTDKYRQGAADWRALQAWFASQTGDRHVGADFWAANRSKAGHKSCAEAGDDYTGNKAAFVAGCEEAKRQLDPIDAKRLNREYLAGFNDEAQRLPSRNGEDCSNAHVAAALSDLHSASQQLSIVEAYAQAASQGLAGMRVWARMQLGCSGRDGDCLSQTAEAVMRMQDKSTTSAWKILMLTSSFDPFIVPDLGDRLGDAIKATTSLCEILSGAKSSSEEITQHKNQAKEKIGESKFLSWHRDNPVVKDLDDTLVEFQIISHGALPGIASGRKALDTIYGVSDKIDAALGEIEALN